VSVIAAALLLASCRGRFVSPAAVVDGGKISQADVQAELDLLATEPQFAAALHGPQADQGRRDLAREALAALISERIATEYADAHGITIGPQDVSAALRRAIAQLGGQAAFQRLLKARGLTLDQARELVRQQVLFGKVEDAVAAQRLGSAAGSATRQQKDAAFNKWMAGRLAHADIQVNPRFGRFDPGTGQIHQVHSTAS